MAANPSVTWHISLHLFLFQTVCNIDKVISVVVTRYVFPTFSSLTLTLSMSSRALVPGPSIAPLTNTQHSSVSPLTAHHWPQTQEEKRNISKNGFLPRLGQLSIWRGVDWKWPDRHQFTVPRSFHYAHTEGKTSELVMSLLIKVFTWSCFLE